MDIILLSYQSDDGGNALLNGSASVFQGLFVPLGIGLYIGLFQDALAVSDVEQFLSAGGRHCNRLSHAKGLQCLLWPHLKDEYFSHHVECLPDLHMRQKLRFQNVSVLCSFLP